MARHSEVFDGATIVVETEPAPRPVLKGMHRLKSVTITRDSKDLKYDTWPSAEQADERALINRAVAHAKVYLMNRGS